MKTQILRKKNDLSLISQTDKTWILNNGAGINQIATWKDLKNYKPNYVTIPSGTTMTKCPTFYQIYLATSSDYELINRGPNNKLMKFSELNWKSKGISIIWEVYSRTGIADAIDNILSLSFNSGIRTLTLNGSGTSLRASDTILGVSSETLTYISGIVKLKSVSGGACRTSLASDITSEISINNDIENNKINIRWSGKLMATKSISIYTTYM